MFSRTGFAWALPWPGAERKEKMIPADQEGVFTAEQRNYWAFQPVSRPHYPQVARADWVSNSVDLFILSKLEEKGLEPAPPADKAALLRRAAFDLTGVPPTVQEIEDFLADDSPDAFEKVVDRLLASPR